MQHPSQPYSFEWIVPDSLKHLCPFGLPPLLYIRTSLPKTEALSLLGRLPEDGLGIVGTRGPEVRSRELVRETVKSLRDSKLVIVSGFARGIDHAAHMAAIEFGLPTIALLASGLDRPYPAHHHQLAPRLLAAGGLLISEHPEGTDAYPSHFLDRNRLIAWLSKALWVAEAGAGSGALNTASWMRKLERPVFATPAFPGERAFLGNRQLMEECTPPASPLFSRRGLESVWLGLISERFQIRAERDGQLRLGENLTLSPDAAALTGWVDTEFTSGRGTGLDRCYESFQEQGWSSARWYLALQESLEASKMIQENGQLLKNS